MSYAVLISECKASFLNLYTANMTSGIQSEILISDLQEKCYARADDKVINSGRSASMAFFLLSDMKPSRRWLA